MLKNVNSRPFLRLGWHIVSPGRGVCDENMVTIYEVHLLENGNIQFVAIEEECVYRASVLACRPDNGITREYETVP